MSTTNGHADLKALREQLETLRIQKEIATLQAEDSNLLESRLAAMGSFFGDWANPFDLNPESDGFRVVYPNGIQSRKDGRNRPFIWYDYDLDWMRDQARWLATENEFGVGVVERVKDYTVRTGYEYEAVPSRRFLKDDRAKQLAELVQGFLDDFQAYGRVGETNEQYVWADREAEAIRRKVRDGEVFLRCFPVADSFSSDMSTVRFVEPEQIRQPVDRQAPNWSFGIETDPRDIETVLSYAVSYDPNNEEDWDQVPANEIAHFKDNVDSTIKRGISDFFSNASAFEEASKLLKNMRITAGVQAALAWIEQYDSATGSAVRDAIAGRRDANRARTTDPITGKTQDYQKYTPGSIPFVGRGKTYIPAPLAQNTTQHVQIMQAALRALGNRWGMPEYMISSDASNANYASTLVSGAPFVLAIEATQARLGRYFLRVLWMAIRNAANAGRFKLAGHSYGYGELIHMLDLNYTAPEVAIANDQEAATIDHQDIAAGVMSKQTRRAKLGLDDEQERRNLEEEPVEQQQDPMGGGGFGGMFGESLREAQVPTIRGPKKWSHPVEALLAKVLSESVKKFTSLAGPAVARMVDDTTALWTGQPLFTDDEREQFVSELAAVISTANLTGRSLVGEQARRIRKRHGVTESAELFRGPKLKQLTEGRLAEALEPTEALDFFRDLVPTLGTDPLRVLPDLQRTAFTLAVATERELLEAVKEVILGSITSGQVGDGAKSVQAVLDAAGISPRNSGYAEMVFRTNAMDAYNQGVQNQMIEEQETFPVWQYSNPDDTRSRKHHAEKNGNYYPVSRRFVEVRGTGIDDAARCRCVPIPIDKWTWEGLESRGVQLSEGLQDPCCDGCKDGGDCERTKLTEQVEADEDEGDEITAEHLDLWADLLGGLLGDDAAAYIPQLINSDLQESRLSEGFTGEKKDKRGNRICYKDGKRVPCERDDSGRDDSRSNTEPTEAKRALESKGWKFSEANSEHTKTLNKEMGDVLTAFPGLADDLQKIPILWGKSPDERGGTRYVTSENEQVIALDVGHMKANHKTWKDSGVKNAFVDPSPAGLIRHELGHAIEGILDHETLVKSGVFTMQYFPSAYSQTSMREKVAEFISQISSPGFDISSLPEDAQVAANTLRGASSPGKRLSEGFTGEKKDKRGRRMCYRDGKRVPCEKKDTGGGDKKKKATAPKRSKEQAIASANDTISRIKSEGKSPELAKQLASDLGSLTVPQLKGLAKEHGVGGVSKAKKAQLQQGIIEGLDKQAHPGIDEAEMKRHFDIYQDQLATTGKLDFNDPRLRDPNAKAGQAAEQPKPAQGEELRQSAMSEIEDLIAENHSFNGMLPIHELRNRIREKHGDDSAAHKALDQEIRQLRREGKIRLIPLSDLTRATRDQLNASIDNIDETLFYIEIAKPKTTKKDKPAESPEVAAKKQEVEDLRTTMKAHAGGGDLAQATKAQKDMEQAKAELKQMEKGEPATVEPEPIKPEPIEPEPLKAPAQPIQQAAPKQDEPQAETPAEPSTPQGETTPSGRPAGTGNPMDGAAAQVKHAIPDTEQERFEAAASAEPHQRDDLLLASFNDMMDKMALFDEYEDGVVSVPHLYDEMKAKIPNLSAGEFNDMLIRQEDNGIELKIRNEVHNIPKGDEGKFPMFNRKEKRFADGSTNDDTTALYYVMKGR